MRIAKVIGTVTLSRCMPELRGGRYLVVAPESAAVLRDESSVRGTPFVAFDGVSAGIGARVAVSEGREASQPFLPALAPVDAYCAAILDEVDLTPRRRIGT